MHNIIDSRDLEDTLQELKAMETRTELEEETIKEIEELKEEVEGFGWDNGIIFIYEHYFVEYIKDYMQDCFNIPEGLYPYINIDNFACDMKMDYSSVEYKGYTYYYREA